jgi:hypothetical protein
MKKYFLVASVLLALGAGRAAAQNENTIFDKHTDFYKYKTYKWVSIESAQHLDELSTEQLTATLEVELAKKGLTKSPSDTADLYIGFQIARNTRKALSRVNIGASYGSAAGATAGTAGAATTIVHSGLLVLDMYDSASKKLVWRSLVSHAVDANAKPDKRQKHMDNAVEKLLKDYPPKKS